MKKLGLAAAAVGAMLLLSSCFVLQGFTVVANSVAPGGKTVARFTVHPMQKAKKFSGVAIRTNYQFIIVGVPSSGDLAVGGATWGVNGKFGGPQKMLPSAPLPAAMGSSCAANGLNFADITNTTWKAFLTNGPINDHGKVNQDAVINAAIRAKPSAAHATSHTIFGVVGTWVDDGDGVVNGADTFLCMGIASSSLFVN